MESQSASVGNELHKSVPRTIAVLPGDGIGPEVTTAATAVLQEACKLAGITVNFEHALIGMAAIAQTGESLPPANLELCRNADAVLLGAVDTIGSRSQGSREESAVVRLRRALELFANVRPVQVSASLAAHSTIRPEIAQGTDFVLVREIAGGVYTGLPRERRGVSSQREAIDTVAYGYEDVAAVARLAFELAVSRRGQLTSVDKANIMATSELWREVVSEIAHDYSQVDLHHCLIDSCALRLIQAPRDFDVIVTENLFGDILADEAAALCGSLGMLPSASISRSGPSLYEPVHGSAPELAGLGTANPCGAILSAALLLEMSFDLPVMARAVREAVDAAVARGITTADLGGSSSTTQVTEAILNNLATNVLSAETVAMAQV